MRPSRFGCSCDNAMGTYDTQLGATIFDGVAMGALGDDSTTAPASSVSFSQVLSALSSSGSAIAQSPQAQQDLATLLSTGNVNLSNLASGSSTTILSNLEQIPGFTALEQQAGLQAAQAKAALVGQQLSAWYQANQTTVLAGAALLVALYIMKKRREA